MKRGTDHTWELVKYLGDYAIYSKCKCKYEYNCSIINHSNGIEVVPKIFYFYCPNCGARKKWVTEEVRKIEKYRW